MRAPLLALTLFVTGCGNTEVIVASPGDEDADAGTGGSGGGTQSATGGGTQSSTGGGTQSGTGGGTQSGTGGGAQTACSAATCSGCCALGVCQPGTSQTACGAGGLACSTCLTAQVCKADHTCGTNAPPGVDPASVWVVQPSAATIANFPWDDLSDPDPEVDLWCPATEADYTAYAPKRSDTFNPTWSSMTGTCEMTAAALMATGFGFGVYDVDFVDYETITPYSEVKVSQAQFTAGQIVLPAMEGLTSLTFKLTKK